MPEEGAGHLSEEGLDEPGAMFGCVHVDARLLAGVTPPLDGHPEVPAGDTRLAQRVALVRRPWLSAVEAELAVVEQLGLPAEVEGADGRTATPCGEIVAGGGGGRLVRRMDGRGRHCALGARKRRQRRASARVIACWRKSVASGSSAVAPGRGPRHRGEVLGRRPRRPRPSRPRGCAGRSYMWCGADRRRRGRKPLPQ